ncbi:MAG: GWxTD domain-containing protein [Sphingobacteriales bacterium]|jgi:GWxTD domain-containing protein
MRFLLSLLLITGFCLNLQAQKLQGYASSSLFQTEEGEKFIEIYYNINGNSIRYQDSTGFMENAGVLVSLSAEKNDSVIYADKFNLLAETTTDSLNNHPNIIDQIRLKADTGNYRYILTVKDLNDTSNDGQIIIDRAIVENTDSIFISDLTFIESKTPSTGINNFNKGGYFIIPWVGNYFPGYVEKLNFYLEIYHNKETGLNDGTPFLLSYYLEGFEKGNKLLKFNRFKRLTKENINAIIGEFDLSQLLSGNYFLVIELKNDQNEIIAEKKVFFQRSNPSLEPSLDDYKNTYIENTFVENMPKDSVLRYLNYLYARSTPRELNMEEILAKEQNDTLARQFFYTFWSQRNYSNPAKEWGDYKQLVYQANNNFHSQFNPGYRTDRGRVYLQYGKPNQIINNSNNPDTYPYEVWHYYQIGQQSDRRFIYFEPTRVTNDYQLLHSDALGENTDPNWRDKLVPIDSRMPSIDGKNRSNNFGSQLERDIND